MIHRTGPAWQPSQQINTEIDGKSRDHTGNPAIVYDHWQTELQQAIRDPKELLDILNISDDYLPGAQAASRLFPLRVPRSFVARMEAGNPNDPLLQQVLPLSRELTPVEGYSSDPVGEQQGHNHGVIQKYHGRVLFVVNGLCAVNCRYCFRREFPYADNRLSRPEWEQAIATIAKDTRIEEVIYSGGDPLASSDRQLTWLTQQLASIPHLKRLRIHTRFPVVIPSRITDDCLDWLTSHRLASVMVLHINHANELQDQRLLDSLKTLKHAGVTLLNQAVLLKGINDDVETQTQLNSSLFDAGVLPYYLHTLDKVNGAAHFDIPLETAKSLYRDVQARQSGYLVPKLVTETAGQPSKTLVPVTNL